jgi:uncharacterized protein YodC (DUF2158 family)
MTFERPRVTEFLAVREKRGGPVMTIEAKFEHLFLCVWMDESGRTRRQAFSPNELVAYQAEDLTWIRVLARLAYRWPVGAT